VETVEKRTKRGYLAWQLKISGLVVEGSWQSVVIPTNELRTHHTPRMRLRSLTFLGASHAAAETARDGGARALFRAAPEDGRAILC
jgi:hypothetical protein